MLAVARRDLDTRIQHITQNANFNPKFLETNASARAPRRCKIIARSRATWKSSFGRRGVEIFSGYFGDGRREKSPNLSSPWGFSPASPACAPSALGAGVRGRRPRELFRRSQGALTKIQHHAIKESHASSDALISRKANFEYCAARYRCFTFSAVTCRLRLSLSGFQESRSPAKSHHVSTGAAHHSMLPVDAKSFTNQIADVVKPASRTSLLKECAPRPWTWVPVFARSPVAIGQWNLGTPFQRSEGVV